MAKKKATSISEETTEANRLAPTEYIETCNIGFDLALTNGLGIPMGSNIMLFGKPGHGKTTIIGDVLVRLLRRFRDANLPFRVHYVDSENSKELLTKLGLMEFIYDPEVYMPQQVIYHPNVNSFAYVENMYTRITNYDKKHKDDVWGKDIKIIVVDSLTNLIADSQLDRGVNDSDFGDNSKARKKLYLKWLAPLREYGLTNIWTSQVSVKQGAGTYEDPNKPAISQHDEHNMEIIVKMVKSTDSKRTVLKKQKIKTISGEQEVQQRYITKLFPGNAAYTKNRFGQSVPVEVLVQPGVKVLNPWTLRNVYEMHGMLDRPNSVTWTLDTEVTEALGVEPIEKVSLKEINTFFSANTGALVQYAKEHGMYSVYVKPEEAEVDDGLF